MVKNKMEIVALEEKELHGSQDQSSKKCYAFIVFVLLASLITFIIGVVLLNRDPDCTAKPVKQTATYYAIKDLNEYCKASPEAERIKLNNFLQKCQKLYFKIYPHEEIAFNLNNANQDQLNEISRKFTPYVPTPQYLKGIADETHALIEEVEKLKPNEDLMKPKESQIFDEIKIFLDQFMASVYDIDFYGGDWMFGPNYFCMNRICYLPHEVNSLTLHFRPKSLSDVKFLVKTFQGYKQTFEEYIANMKLGVNVGMVRSKLSCQSGSDALKQNYIDVLEQSRYPWFSNNINSREFYKYLPRTDIAKWKLEHNNTSVRVSLNKALEDGFSKPFRKLYKYLTEEHITHCPPDDEASGISVLPLQYVYVNGKAMKDQPTTQKLPITNTKLDGNDLYRKFVKRFTTTNLTPPEIFKEGEKQLNIFYPQLVNLTKEYTKINDEDKAVEKMKAIMEGDAQWHAFNFPENESNAQAHARCSSPEKAKKYCPVRWKGIKKWGNYLNRILSMIHPKLYDAFHFTGDFNSVPNCPVLMTPHYNPSNGAMYFDASDAECSQPTQYGLPFFLEKYGPRFQEWSVNGHEARPGHHFQYQGSVELFSNPCTNGLDSFFHQKGYFTGFIEGWALYGENPVLSHDVELYKDNKLQKAGMLKWQVWRAVRLVVDTGLHFRGMNRSWALQQFEKYAWDKTDFGRKEVTRYMSCPGQATAYMIGRLAILKARRKAEKELGSDFNLKDFHYQVLSIGQAPLAYLTKHIDRYINCKKNPLQKYCEYLLTSVRSIPKGENKTLSVEKMVKTHFSRPYRHYL